MPKPRLELTDSIQDVCVKMCDGNPKALRVCVEMIKHGAQIDPDSIGGFGAVLSLDTLGLYGSKIWMLYKDVCECDLPNTLAVLRSWQLGIINESQLHHAVDSYGNGLDLSDIYAKVAKRLPQFRFSKDL